MPNFCAEQNPARSRETPRCASTTGSIQPTLGQSRHGRILMSGSKKTGSRLVADKRPSKRTSKPARKPRRRARKASTRRRGPIAWLFGGLFRLVWGIGWRVTALVTIAVGGAVLFYAATLPPVTTLLDGRSKGSVTLLDRDGEIFAWRGEQFGGQITADTVSPDLKHAIIATEDRRFYRHFGVSPRGIASAVRINLSEGR